MRVRVRVRVTVRVLHESVVVHPLKRLYSKVRVRVSVRARVSVRVTWRSRPAVAWADGRIGASCMTCWRCRAIGLHNARITFSVPRNSLRRHCRCCWHGLKARTNDLRASKCALARSF